MTTREETATRLAIVAIIVEDPGVADDVNRLLHEYREWVVGRMGIPCRERGVAVISVVLDAPQPTVSALSGKLGMLPGINVKTVYSNVTNKEKSHV